ncbi:MAG: hypothetical protein U9N34_00485 [Candidatus Cloacimonadota bacterium]|nr:hypothetical protein [Candidatus Cloacimonadota bacterium]
MKKKYRVFSLFSGGLDSVLSTVIMQNLGYEVIPINIKTPFFSPTKAIDAAKLNNLHLQVFDITERYLKMLQNPRYGYGKNMNPCIDCHGLMMKVAAEKMDEFDIDFIISGEVLGQRPMSQKKNSLQAVAKLSSIRDLIIRPLSQKLLEDTKPIRDGWVDKSQMLDFQGRGRRRQMNLAKELNIEDFESPGGGCLLTEKVYSIRLKDLISHKMFSLQNILFLKDGRHFRLDEKTKLIVGRHKSDNDILSQFIIDEIILKTKYSTGPLGILISEKVTNENIEISAKILLRYNSKADNIAIVSYGKNNNLNSDIEVEKMKNEEIDKFRII